MIQARWSEESEARLGALEALVQRGEPLTGQDFGALQAFSVFGPESVRVRVETLRRLTAKPKAPRPVRKATAEPEDPLVAAVLADLRRGRGDDA